MEHMTTDILIIGAGAAGLRAAADAAASGQRTLVVSKLPPGLGTSTIMSGGAMAGHSQGGSIEGHRNATLAAGRGFNQADLLEVFVAEAPSRLQELVDWGLKSTAKFGGLFSYGKAGALGRGMIDCLWAKAASRGARSLAGVMVWHISFDRQGGRVLAFHPKQNQWLLIRSKAVVLATGGASALYLYHDNPQRMMGEGYTLALEAGATLQDMEFAQFFPLALAEPGKPLHLFPPSLEVVGSLINTKGEDIHKKYNLTELPAARKARDKLSQALFREISQGQETFIDLRGVTKEEWCADPFAAELWDQLAVKCKATERKLRITPAAHFFVGGATIDPDCNTAVPGFFICGEAAGGGPRGQPHGRQRPDRDDRFRGQGRHLGPAMGRERPGRGGRGNGPGPGSSCSAFRRSGPGCIGRGVEGAAQADHVAGGRDHQDRGKPEQGRPGTGPDKGRGGWAGAGPGPQENAPGPGVEAGGQDRPAYRGLRSAAAREPGRVLPPGLPGAGRPKLAQEILRAP